MKVIYFASVKQTIGIAEESIEIKQQISVNDLIKILKKKNSQYNLALNSSSVQCAVNCKFVNKSHIVKNTDEVAFFPPVTGG